jgi:hypothetical protein
MRSAGVASSVPLDQPPRAGSKPQGGRQRDVDPAHDQECARAQPHWVVRLFDHLRLAPRLPLQSFHPLDFDFANPFRYVCAPTPKGARYVGGYGG